jgi:hypothetical protein
MGIADGYTDEEPQIFRAGRQQFDRFARKQLFQSVAPDFVRHETNSERPAFLIWGNGWTTHQRLLRDSHPSCVRGLALAV